MTATQGNIPLSNPALSFGSDENLRNATGKLEFEMR